jgi:hypothetical protein
MKKILSFLAVSAFLLIPAQGAFAWTYDGLGSLNPFTNFGRGFGNDCGCERPRLTKCEKLHGYKIHQGTSTGYAAPVVVPVIQTGCQEPMPVIYDNCPNCAKTIYMDNPCPTCRRAF